MDSRATGYIMMYGDEASKIFSQAVGLLKQHGYNIHVLNELKSGTGNTELTDDGRLEYRVGSKGIVDKPYSRFPINEALAPTVTCFHEVCGHGGQWRNEIQKDTPLSKVLLLNDLACKSSNLYYGVTHDYTEPYSQYFEQPHEIAAQYMALKMTQKFLSTIYDKEYADKMLTQYVNMRIASSTEFIEAPDDYEMEIPEDGRAPFMKPSEPFNCMDEVYEHFQKTFEVQVFKPAEYWVDKNSQDAVGKHIKKEWPWERPHARELVNNMSDRLTQVYVLSATWLEQHQDYAEWMKKLPALKNIDFPEKIRDLIDNTPNQPEKEDLDLGQLTEDDIDFIRAVEQIDMDVGPKL